MDLKEGPPFDVIGGLSFSDDGRHVSYAGADIKTGFGGDKGLGRAVIDGEPGPQFEGEKSSSMLQAMATGPTSLVAGNFGDLSVRLHGVSAPVFSADSSRVAYLGPPGQGKGSGRRRRPARAAVHRHCLRSAVQPRRQADRVPRAPRQGRRGGHRGRTAGAAVR